MSFVSRFLATVLVSGLHHSKFRELHLSGDDPWDLGYVYTIVRLYTVSVYAAHEHKHTDVETGIRDVVDEHLLVPFPHLML